MIWNKYSGLRNSHAFLSPSSYHWVNYTEDKLVNKYRKHKMAVIGTRLHSFAEEAISLSVRLPRTAASLNSFVNDSIGFKLTPEQILYYSPNCFGTADAIGFEDDVLRIFDLKTGESPASMTQLEVYAAIFCLEYAIDPETIEVELRIYQNDEIQIYSPRAESINRIMQTIIIFDDLINGLNK